MFEKKIKNFFNSVTVCGEFPAKKQGLSKKHYTMITVAAGISCVLFGALLATRLMDKIGQEADEEGALS